MVLSIKNEQSYSSRGIFTTSDEQQRKYTFNVFTPIYLKMGTVEYCNTSTKTKILIYNCQS